MFWNPTQSQPIISSRASQPQDAQGQRPAIVLVEDEPDVLIILHHLMRSLTRSYDIIAVYDGFAALDQLALAPVPLLITDYNMPGMDGLQLTQSVKQMSPATRVVMITAYATAELEVRARTAGVDNYLAKPFPFSELERIVRNAVA